MTHRQGTGSLAPSDDYNRTFALDGRWGIGRYGLVSGFVARTATADISDDEYAFKWGGRYDSPAWLITANYTEVGPGFNPEVGFMQRIGGFRKGDFRIMYRRRLTGGAFGLNELCPHIT